MPSDPPEKLTVGEHSPAKVSPVLWVADARDPLSSDSTVLSSLLFKSRFLAFLQKSYLQFLRSKNCETNFVMFLEMASF